jgi:hypothetical protein
MKIKNRIYKSELIEWQKVNDLQPELLKEHYNINHLRKSILKYGVSKAYDICEIEGELYWLDGHTRTEMFRTLQSEGIEIPKMLMANFCEVKNRQEAISILLEVHNIKHDPINNEVLTEWVNIEQVEVEVVSLNVIDLGQAAPDIDYSILDDDDIDDQLKEMTDGVKKAIQIEFEAEHYEEAYELVKFWREQKLYVGGFLMEKLKAEKDKL